MKLSSLLFCRDGREGFFSQGEPGPGKAKKQGGAGKESKSAGRGRAYISWLKSYPTADETLICFVWSEGSQIYSTFIFLIIIMIIIIDQCCYIVSLRLSWIGKILECHLYFAPRLPCGFDCFAGRGISPLPWGSILTVLCPQYCQVLFFYLHNFLSVKVLNLTFNPLFDGFDQ